MRGVSFGVAALFLVACGVEPAPVAVDPASLNQAPAVLSAQAACSKDGKTWTVWASVDDPNGLEDITEVDVFATEETTNERIATILLAPSDDASMWTAELPADAALDCRNPEISFSFVAMDARGASDTFVTWTDGIGGLGF